MSSVPLSATGAHQPFGFAADGPPVFAPYRPTIRKMAGQIPAWLRSGIDLSTAIPIPAGLPFSRGEKNQPHLTLPGSYARRFRRIFGYVGDIQLSCEARGALTPAQLTIAALTPWRYGDDPREAEDSFIFCRINAFASKALLTWGGGFF